MLELRDEPTQLLMVNLPRGRRWFEEVGGGKRPCVLALDSNGQQEIS